MAKKIEISDIRAKQFNNMVAMLRDIRRYDGHKKLSEYTAKGFTPKEAARLTVGDISRIAIGSRGISELKGGPNA